MTDGDFDLEELAAFIDGKLDGEARARMVKLLAESEAAYEAYIETVRFQGGEIDPKVVPIATPKRATPRLWKIWVPVAAAATLALLVGRSLTVSGGGPARLDYSAAGIVSELTAREDLASSLGEGWERPGWTETRGATSRLAESARAFRLGVRNVDLHIALRLQEASLANGFLSEIMEWLGGIELSQAVLARYADVRQRLTAPGDSGAVALEAAEEALDEFLSSTSLALGKWTEAARLSTAVREPRFFESDETSRLLDTLDNLGLPDPDVAALREIRTLVNDGVAESDFQELRRLVQDMIRRNGG